MRWNQHHRRQIRSLATALARVQATFITTEIRLQPAQGIQPITQSSMQEIPFDFECNRVSGSRFNTGKGRVPRRHSLAVAHLPVSPPANLLRHPGVCLGARLLKIHALLEESPSPFGVFSCKSHLVGPVKHELSGGIPFCRASRRADHSEQTFPGTGTSLPAAGT